eukprot:GDKI01037203.1.p1 GENE.GDKI01037203.1~~GDKI01037203.1.p1  ORF type:complete len:710 (+),score=268.12 GDKI01037203.1:80-2209(+)
MGRKKFECDPELEEWLSDGDGEPYDQLEAPIPLNSKFPTTMIVVGLPVVGEDKHAKLVQLLQTKILSKFGTPTEVNPPVNPGEFYLEMPFDSNGQTKGACFLTWSSEEECQQVCKELNNTPLDKVHVFKTMMMDSMEQVMNRPDQFKGVGKLNVFARTDFTWWLHDERSREQFVVRYGDMTEIFWHDPVHKVPSLVYDGARERQGGTKVWTEYKVQWSPLGSYLVTFHKPGIALWAGPDFEKKVRFEHRDVRQIQFSPDEKYILTWNGAPYAQQDENAYKLFNVQTGEHIRSFPTPPIAPRGGDFPHFLWSADSKFVAKADPKNLFIYAMPDATLTEDGEGKKTPMKFPDGLERFDWSPTDNLLSVWTPEKGEKPARLQLINPKTRETMGGKNLVMIKDAAIHWQSRGDFLALHALRVSKSGKTSHHQVEVFRIRSGKRGNIPVESCEIRGNVTNFWWEPSGNRFAVLLADEATHARKCVFYQVNAEDIRQCASVDLPATINSLTWAPTGQYFVLSAMGPEGTLIFCSLGADNKLDVYHKDEHFMVNDVTWDPTGRYVVTGVNIPMVAPGMTAAAWRYSNEAGYAIWTFQGRLQHKSNKDKFYQAMWRPHPPSLLDAKKQEEVKKNLKEYSKKFDDVDNKLRTAQLRAFQEKRQREMEAFLTVKASHKQWTQEHDRRREWEDAMDDFLESQDWEEREDVSEEVLEVKEM